ncbi:MAG: YggT family protein [Clostridia bacterium]|nr:YggT family protein [Clostridia bacterium]
MLEILDYVLSSLIITACSLLSGVLMINVLISWFFPEAEGPFFNIIRNVSYFLVTPARVLLDRTGWFADLPIDMSYLLTMITLSLVSSLFTFL